MTGPAPAGPGAPADQHQGLEPRSVLLITSNGTGMGHLARQLATAIHLRRLGLRPVVLSLSTAVASTTSLGIPAEYCPSPARGWIPGGTWDFYLRDRIRSLALELDADVIAFDGVAPYRGLLMARAELAEVPFAWVRRGMWRSRANRRALRAEPAFDLVAEPGDLGSEEDRGPTAADPVAVRFGPVSLLGAVDQLARSEAAAALGLDPHRPAALVTLGSGALGDTDDVAATVLSRLLQEPDLQVALVTSSIARKRAGPSGLDRTVVHVRGVFPLARYLSAFDFAVSAAGYNAVHELVPSIPTLVVPNYSTRTDDQGARAYGLIKKDWALGASDVDDHGLLAGLDLLCDPRRRSEFWHHVCQLHGDEIAVLESGAGARDLARALAGLAAGDEPAQRQAQAPAAESPAAARTRSLALRTKAARRLALARAASESAALRAGGPRGRQLATALTGRGRSGAPAVRLPVVPVSDVPAAAEQLAAPGGGPPDPEHPLPLVVTRELTETLMREDLPVEHVLAGTSWNYLDRRMRIAAHAYVMTGEQTAPRAGESAGDS